MCLRQAMQVCESGSFRAESVGNGFLLEEGVVILRRSFSFGLSKSVDGAEFAGNVY